MRWYAFQCGLITNPYGEGESKLEDLGVNYTMDKLRSDEIGLLCLCSNNNTSAVSSPCAHNGVEGGVSSAFKSFKRVLPKAAEM